MCMCIIIKMGRMRLEQGIVYMSMQSKISISAIPLYTFRYRTIVKRIYSLTFSMPEAVLLTKCLQLFVNVDILCYGEVG